MNIHDRQLLRQIIDQQQSRIRGSVPADREAAILAILRARDRLMHPSESEPLSDLVTGRRLADLGGNKALQLCLESPANDEKVRLALSEDRQDDWAARILEECHRLAEAELVLAHGETGFMQMVDSGNGTFDAWIATKRTPTSWRERADFDWWASWLARHHRPELSALQVERRAASGSDPEQDAVYRRISNVHLEMMANQLGYPLDAAIGGCSIQTYRDVLAWLIGWVLRIHDRGGVPPARSERSLIDAIASTLAIEPAVVGLAVAAFTLDREGAAYHAAVPGVAAAPLVRVNESQLAPSVRGLTMEPLLFLTRELKRRDAREYHNTAYLREAVFRQDLYALFQDKRFVTSAGRIQLRREIGDVRTDIDAVVFDRKTGTLAVFELKSQDPFARSTAELARQRDNFFYANRQVSGVLAWLQLHGADALLSRVDTRTAKTFRVQKVYPFVLGRHLAHFSGGPEPDRRAAWGSWPQMLRLLDGQAVRDIGANPLASLFTRLTRVPIDSFPSPPAGVPARDIPIGSERLIVHPSWAAFQASAGVEHVSQ